MAYRSLPLTRSTPNNVLALIALLFAILALNILLACGGDDGPPIGDDDDWDDDHACCNRGEYYECPNRSAANQCDGSFFPDTNCNRKPKKDKYCR